MNLSTGHILSSRIRAPATISFQFSDSTTGDNFFSSSSISAPGTFSVLEFQHRTPFYFQFLNSSTGGNFFFGFSYPSTGHISLDCRISAPNTLSLSVRSKCEINVIYIDSNTWIIMKFYPSKSKTASKLRLRTEITPTPNPREPSHLPSEQLRVLPRMSSTTSDV